MIGVILDEGKGVEERPQAGVAELSGYLTQGEKDGWGKLGKTQSPNSTTRFWKIFLNN